MVRDTERSNRVKVLYIAGSGRSGSTLLDSILGQVPGFFSVGEVRYIWERGVLQDRSCGCGQPFSRCDFWKGVMRAAFGEPSGVDARRMIELQRKGMRVRHIPTMLGNPEAIDRKMGPYYALTADLYRAIGSQSGCRVVVDSSKLPAYGRMLSTIADLHVVHLIRDPRAAAFSWSSRKPAPDRADGLMQQQGAIRSAALWSIWNWTAERLWSHSQGRYLQLRYDDLIARPKESVGLIVRMLSEEPENLPFKGESVALIAPTHSVAGNPSRFKTGEVELKLDDRWLRQMPAPARLAVTATTLPLLRRFGFPIRTPKDAAPAAGTEA